MKKLFYAGLFLLALFEILNVYFIMPMPGSQELDSVGIAYFLHQYRWYFRVVSGIIVVAGSFKALQSRHKWIPVLAIIPVIAIIYNINFEMTADHMFLQPEKLAFKGRSENTLSDSSLVIAVSCEGDAKAYPVRYILYHHQVRDTVGGKPLMITYCNVCRTGRVYEPLVNGKPETFRLVGMDHFNAMFEDRTTKSWWQQSTGTAITGQLKGTRLPEFESSQITINKFFTLYPFGNVMQPEDASMENYDMLGRFEWGKSKNKLTRTDSVSWKDKSWVVGIQIGHRSKAYDWNDLKRMRVIHDTLGDVPVILALSDDDQSFAAFQRGTAEQTFAVRNDSLVSGKIAFDFAGRSATATPLSRIKAYQEFWHSWKTFHPDTRIFK
jgi:hypothetical protein